MLRDGRRDRRAGLQFAIQICFSATIAWPWPSNLTRYGQIESPCQTFRSKSIRSKVVVDTHTHTHTDPHSWPTSLLEPLEWSVKWVISHRVRSCLRQGGYVIVVVCRSVCLSVSNFAQKLPNGFARNFQKTLAMGHWTDYKILVAMNPDHRLNTGIVFFEFVTIGRYGKWLTDIHSYWFARWRHR